jgi:hypothetical protein
MKFTRVIALAVIAASTGIAGVHAQNLRNASQPAEFPPASYKSTQYVDSRGCVFVRAGISGNVTWVPRVTRSRNQVCNQKPSLAGRVAAAAPAPAAAQEPVQITIDQPAKPKPVAAAKPKVRKPVAVAAAKPATIRKPIVRKPVVRRAPAQVATAAPIQIIPAKKPQAVQPKPVVRQTTAPAVRRQTACAGASAVSQRYLSGPNVRCGPQTAAISSGQRAAGGYGNNNINGATRVVPKHVLIKRQNTQNLPLPEGYTRVWEDDRLNPNRAEQSLAGQAAVKLIWTNTVPRRLINQSNGRDVTASVPLVYPYLDVTTQTRDLGVVSIVQRDGQVLKRIQRNSARVNTPVRQPTLSSRSVPKPAATKTPARAVPKAAAASQVVQVGTYGSQSDAQKVAKRLQRMGMPVRIGKFTRSGQTLRMVLVGPFGRDAAQQLSAVRRAGYGNAFLRN